MDLRHPRRPTRRLPAARLAGGLLTFGLALFHGGLLWQRVADGTLLQPAVAARWIVSALVAWIMLRLWSRGLPLLHGRRAVVLWLVVLVLHLGVPGDSLPAAAPGAQALLAVPALLAALALVGLARGSHRLPQPGPGRRARSTGPVRRLPGGGSPALYSRPPPAALPI